VVQRTFTVATPAIALALVAWWSGGYFPRTWGALLLAVAIGLAAVGILAVQVEIHRRALVFVGALGALCAWELVTTAWAVAPDSPALEAERTLVYAGAVAVAFLAVPKVRAPELVLGVLAGTGAATIGGLVEHGLGAGTPDDRLELPVGYPNASGILATTTLLVGLGLTGSTSRVTRMIGGAVVPAAAVALALSLSRGSILAAALGILVLCVVTASHRDLGRAALTAVPAVAALALVSLTGSLGDSGARPREVLALVAVGVLSLVAGGAAAWVPEPSGARSEESTGGARRRALVAAACAVGAVLMVAVATHEVRESRAAPTTLGEPSSRLLSTSTSSRGEYWDVAARMVEDHPLGGAGAGSFTRVWLRERPALIFVRDAHNLYLETLAELGPVGLIALLAALATPFLGLRHAVGHATGRAALAAYAALVVHATLDWDWELPAVTLGTLFLGVALVQLGALEHTRRVPTMGRAALLTTAALLAVLAIVVHAGNGATADANDLLDRGDAGAARAEADRARRYRPWAAEPWELLGEAHLAAGNTATARTDLLRATRADPGSWSAWLSLALASTGRERTRALARARELNPLAPELEAVSGGEHP
jgi:hypothetical protein